MIWSGGGKGGIKWMLNKACRFFYSGIKYTFINFIFIKCPSLWIRLLRNIILYYLHLLERQLSWLPFQNKYCVHSSTVLLFKTYIVYSIALGKELYVSTHSLNCPWSCIQSFSSNEIPPNLLYLLMPNLLMCSAPLPTFNSTVDIRFVEVWLSKTHVANIHNSRKSR